MKTTLLRGSDTVFSDITADMPARNSRAISIKRIDKHTHACRIGDRRFVFRSARSSPRETPRGPGIELRHTREGVGPAPLDLEELPGSPGLVRSVRFEGPLDLHIERLDERRYWCRIGEHGFSIASPGRRSAGIELVGAGPSSKGPESP